MKLQWLFAPILRIFRFSSGPSDSRGDELGTSRSILILSPACIVYINDATYHETDVRDGLSHQVLEVLQFWVPDQAPRTVP